MTDIGRVTTTLTRRSGWRSVRRSAVLMLWQAAPWVLVVLVVMSLLSNGFAAWSTWSKAQSQDLFTVQGDQGVAVAVSIYVGLAALLNWMSTVRTTVPVLVAGGVTRRAVTGGLLVAVVAAATTAMLALVAVAGAALQSALATSAASAVASSGSDAYTSALTLTTDPSENAFSALGTLVVFVAVALGGALIGAAWYRWRTPGVVGVLVTTGFGWFAWRDVVARSALVTPDAIGSTLGSSLAYLGPCLALAAAVWSVLRRVPLRPPAR